MTEELTERQRLIQRYQQIERDLKASVENSRPICEVLAGELMALAEQLRCTESAQDFIRELQEKAQPKSTGPFSGITGAYT